MTEPPEDSTAVVSWLTAVPLAGTSSRTVIEYETLGAVAMACFLCFPLFMPSGPRECRATSSDSCTYLSVRGNPARLSDILF
ncbi:hypothetical protein GCM10017744_061910 [Streptomyces antimycoticus]|uniref:Uncharacterized protein n=2 Tax=Streptomyces violaceusniger group TaxID=2839105 RepID=A0A4D4K889_9ACTN|nr:hypothetical protein SSPO_060850 [Streptomyces antimycoticus]GDY43140.1 hypothetical protein SANT12839_040220 [Streptomyces antimycoticus]